MNADSSLPRLSPPIAQAHQPGSGGGRGRRSASPNAGAKEAPGSAARSRGVASAGGAAPAAGGGGRSRRPAAEVADGRGSGRGKRAGREASAAKSKARTRGETKGGDGGPRFGWSEAVPLLVAFAWLAVGIAAFVGWQMGEPRLRAYIAARHELRTTASALSPAADLEATAIRAPEVVLAAIEWPVPPVITKSEIIRGRRLPVVDVETELLARARDLAADRSPFDAEPVEAIRVLFAESGWFYSDSVVVRRDLVPAPPSAAGDSGQPATDSAVWGQDGEAKATAVNDPGAGETADDAQADPGAGAGPLGDIDRAPVVDRVTVRARWRQPVALVRHNGRDHVVDADGVLLPMSYAAGEVDMLPVLTGVPSDPPTRPGEAWSGRHVREGLTLLRYLAMLPGADRHWLREIAGIDVSNVDGHNGYQPRLSLLARGGYRIAWGRAVGDEKGIEQPAAAKVEMLDGFFLQRPRITDPNVVVRVNIPVLTFDRPTMGPGSGSADDKPRG